MPDLPRASLSTMWAVQPRFDPDIAAFLTAAAEVGFAGIEVNHSMDPRQTTTLIEAARATGLEARSLHAPAPWSLVDGHGPLHARENRTLNLASLDEAERRLAVAHHIHSIEVAARASMQAVVVHLGGIGILDATLPDEDWLRATYLEWYAATSEVIEGWGGTVRPEPVEGPRPQPDPRPTPSELGAGLLGGGHPPSSVRPEAPLSEVEGPVEGHANPRTPAQVPSDVGAQGLAPSGPRRPPNPRPSVADNTTPSDDPRTTEAWLARIDAAHRARAAIAAPWLDAARRSLAELAARAAKAGVTLGLETRLRYHEFPLPQEAADLLRDHPPEVAGYWHDIGHAEVLSRLGLLPLEAWRTLLATRLVGVHIHDVAGLTDHRAPGNVAPRGSRGAGVDFAALAPQLPPTALRTFEVDQHEPPATLASALHLAQTAGLVG